MKRSASTGDLRPSIHRYHNDLRCPSVVPSSMYGEMVKDLFEPVRLCRIKFNEVHDDARLRASPAVWTRPVRSLTFDLVDDMLDQADKLRGTVRNAERVMDNVHESLFPSRPYVNVGEWAYFDWKSEQPVFMCRPWHRVYTPPSYSRCHDLRRWTTQTGRTFGKAGEDRWRRFAGRRTLHGWWANPPFWQQRFADSNVYKYHKSPWYNTALHKQYDYIQY